MSPDTLVVTGMGMVSSLGLDAVQSSAAARAGMSNAIELDYQVEIPEDFAMVPVVGHPVAYLTQGFSELGRLVRLGSLALSDLFLNSGIEKDSLGKYGVIINLASGYYLRSAQILAQKKKDQNDGEESETGLYEERIPWYKSKIIKKILNSLRLSIAPHYEKVFFEDQTGIINALIEAKKLLESGEIEYCIVGGIDSLLDIEWLDALNELEVLKTDSRPQGFIPGEGSAFLLLETCEHAKQRNRQIMAFIKGFSLKQEFAHRFSEKPQNGIVLSQVIAHSLEKEESPCKTFICNVNGDSARAQEWGCAQVRLTPFASPKELINLADSFGETGAAYGFMATCIGIHSFIRGYYESDSILIWTASDKGTRGSFLVSCDHQPESRE